VYTLGGYFGQPHAYSAEKQSGAFQRMDVQSGTWETLPGIGAAQGLSLSEYQGQLYRVGGMQAHNKLGEPSRLESLATVQRFDPKRGAWQELTPLPEARSSHDAVVVGSQLYVLGGWKLNGAPDSGSWNHSLYVADLTKEPLAWQSVPVSFDVRAFAAVAVAGRIYFIGGIDAKGATSKVYVFDTQQNTWTTGPDFPESGFGVRAAELGSNVVASGHSGKLYSLSPNGSSWSEVGTLAFPRVFHQLVTLPSGQVLVVGGIPGIGEGDRVKHIESLSTSPLSPVVAHFTLENPGTAKNRQGLFQKGNHLYVFGGNNSLGQHDFAAENFVAEARRLDLGSLQFEPVPAFPDARQSMQTVDLDADVAVAVGGFGLSNGKQTTHKDVFEFDFDYESWRKVPRGLPQSRTQFGLVNYDNQLWIFGGLDFDDARKGAERFVHPLPVLRMDVTHREEGFVEAKFDLPRPRRAFASALLGSRYYLVGGMEAGFKAVETCDVYDFSTRSWSQIPSPTRHRIGADLVTLGKKLYLIAGSSKNSEGKLGSDTSIEVFDTETGQWKTWLEQLPISETHQMRSMAFGERILLYSTQRAERLMDIALLDPAVSN
jgi:N-acetylneuraminic acid mutarotase